MEETRSSLLIRAQAGDEGAWGDLSELYRPLIVGWLRRQAVPDGEGSDGTGRHVRAGAASD
jgi:hypothetical protein